MRRIIIFTLLALMMFGGVAAADRSHRHRYRDHRSGGVHVQRVPRHHYRAPRYVVQPTYRPSYRVVRRPIYVQRPVIRYRYYNYYQRPAVIVENHPPMAGYTWVPGQWQWNGYEWIWQPGHYQPDAAYDQYSYPYQNAPYDGSYYGY